MRGAKKRTMKSNHVGSVLGRRNKQQTAHRKIMKGSYPFARILSRKRREQTGGRRRTTTN
jgi:hypothetical protein